MPGITSPLWASFSCPYKENEGSKVFEMRVGSSKTAGFYCFLIGSFTVYTGITVSQDVTGSQYNLSGVFTPWYKPLA